MGLLSRWLNAVSRFPVIALVAVCTAGMVIWLIAEHGANRHNPSKVICANGGITTHVLPPRTDPMPLAAGGYGGGGRGMVSRSEPEKDLKEMNSREIEVRAEAEKLVKNLAIPEDEKGLRKFLTALRPYESITGGAGGGGLGSSPIEVVTGKLPPHIEDAE